MPDAPGREMPRLTASRTAILEAVTMSGGHPSADEIHSSVRASIPKISLATVYRNLDYLSKRGLVRALVDTEGTRRYDVAADDHCHMWCTSCGRVVDVELDPDVAITDLIRDDRGFEIEGQSLSFFGTCPSCRSGAASRRQEDGDRRRG
ncbi:MAG: transcriptional repressor [Candidatus Eisenbacteria bacterium]|nr:transcriptional repressor [Candidatus Eisenbacteria bacterium]